VSADDRTNPNHQELLRKTDFEGTHTNAKIWILACKQCSNVYGCNSGDFWDRKCPKCQRGREGLPIPREREGENWNREEHLIAFNLYCGIPFGTIHMRNPKVIRLAAILGRSVGSVSYKLANFARLDPALRARGIRGMSRGSKGEEEIWREFDSYPEAVAFESEELLADRLGRSIEELAEIDERGLPAEGIERKATILVRVNQSFFRRRILSAYSCRCCVTGLGVPELLVASHIIPWAQDSANRMNARNGLCLNAIHDRAFDRRLMWVDQDLKAHFSKRLRKEARESEPALEWLISFEGRKLILPPRFSPDPSFLQAHARSCED
jgi:putative restriction endonuclease